jgi:hypothetical protein
MSDHTIMFSFPTMDNLKKRHVIVVELCCMCKKSEKLVDYLLLHYVIASVLWSTMFSCVGLAWVMLSRVVDLFACWKAIGGRFQLYEIWKMIS